MFKWVFLFEGYTDMDQTILTLQYTTSVPSMEHIESLGLFEGR